MRAILQRVLYAKVTVDGEVIGKISSGIMALVGFESTDDSKAMEYILNKIINLRIFEDENEKMNLSLLDVKGELMLVPNFTLYGNTRKGNRPSYDLASKPDEARQQFENFIGMAMTTGINIQTGRFQADMKVEILNDGPVTLMLDSDKIF